MSHPFGLSSTAASWHSTPGKNSAKGRALARDPRVVLCVDDPQPPYSFVQVQGIASISEDPKDLLDVATRAGGRYMGADPLLEVDPQYIELAPSVSVDWHHAVDHIGHLFDDGEPAPVIDPQFVTDLLPLLRAGELLDGWAEPWAASERQRYRALRKAARDQLSCGPEKQVANYASGSMRSIHTLHSVRKTKNDSREP